MSSVPNLSLNTGLAALEQGNYSVAIANLESVRETELDETLVTKAEQALIMVYHKSGDTEKAIALCQTLTHHPNPKIQEWANKTLGKLNQTVPTPSNTISPSDPTGFVPFNPPPSSPEPTLPGTSPTNSPKRVLSNAITQDTPPQPSPKTAEPKLASATVSGIAQPGPTPTTDNPSPVTPLPSDFETRPQWRNSERAQKWNPLKAPKLRRLWLIEAVTLVALFWVLHFVLRLVMETTNTLLVKLPNLYPIQLFYRDPTPAVGIALAVLLILSPWLLDILLKSFAKLEHFPLTQLTTRSPEAAKVIQKVCRQRKLPLPTLGILQTNTPVILSYGNLPWTARIVVSEGLLTQLEDDEIAAICAGELGHIAHWDMILMSLGVLVLQIPYGIYWHIARGGEGLAKVIERKLPSYRRFLPRLVRGITGLIASISYGFYWLFRLPLLWLSRARLYYSDRLAADATGNPNAMTRALLKIALGITNQIQQEQHTNGLLESFDLLLPVGYRQAITLGSCSLQQTPLSDILQWDCTNPYRNWLIFTASHPLLGERAAMLCRQAQHWRLEPELDLVPIAPPVRTLGAQFSKLVNSPKAFPLLQSALLFGLLLGIIMRAVLWVIGQIGDKLNIWQIIWMHNASPFLDACILITFSLSLFLWINRYFPDIKPTAVRSEPNLGEVFANQATLPPDSIPVQFTGKLLGRHGLVNGLEQDLILQTATGLVKLHFSSLLGPVGHLLPQFNRPSNLVDQQVTITGWMRRGVTPWIDIETLRTPSGKVIRANYPFWLTLLAVIAALWGAYLIWQA